MMQLAERWRAEPLSLEVSADFQIGSDACRQAKSKWGCWRCRNARPPRSAALLVASLSGFRRKALSRAKWSASRCSCWGRNGRNFAASVSRCHFLYRSSASAGVRRCPRPSFQMSNHPSRNSRADGLAEPAFVAALERCASRHEYLKRQLASEGIGFDAPE